MGERSNQWRRRWRGWPAWARLAVGTLVVLLGVAGLFLPILQGTLLILLGLSLLARDVPPLARARERLRARVKKWRRGRA